MKNKGFTLVEMLTVVSILGVIIILTFPTMMQVFYGARKKLGDYDMQGVEDAGKMYVADLDNDILTYTYNGTKTITVNKKQVTPGTVLSGYDLKVYIIENGPIEVTMETLVKGGYYDENCEYATKPGEKDSNCNLPKTCTLKVGIDWTTSKDGAYYVTKGYTAEIGKGCE